MNKPSVFTKNLSSTCTSKEAQLVFENSLRYYFAAKDISRLKMPRPLKHEDRVIEFVYLSDLNIYPKLSELWYRDESWSVSVCHELGVKLGLLHLAQNTDKEEIFLHGDFVPHNVVLTNDGFIFFDTEPPAHRKSFEQFYYNSRYVDIVSMIFFIITCHYFKTPWRFFRNKKVFIQAYLNGYREASGRNIEARKVLEYMKREQQKWLYDRGVQHGALKKYTKYFFVMIVCWWQFKVCKIF